MHYDPDSPAGKEYALPLDQARAHGASKSRASQKDSGLFGEGISKRSVTTTPAQSGTGSRDATKTRRESDATVAPTPSETSGSSGPAAAVRLGDGDGSGPATGLAIGVAVLLGGLALSLVLRRGRRAATE